MGAGASTLGPTGVGKFQLNEEQKKQNDVLSNLVLALLQNNNLLDLSKLVERSDAKCDELILTLSSQLEKEFQSLRFPDPTRKQKDVQASYMAQDRYRILSTNPDPARKDICRFLATFLLRFVLLIAALVSSISITDAIPSLTRQKMIPVLKTTSTQPTGEKSEVELSEFNKPFSKVMQNLVKTHFAVVEHTSESSTVYVLDNKYNFHDGYLYRRDTPKDKQTKVLGIEVGYVPVSSSGRVPGESTSSYKLLSQFTAEEEYGRETERAKREAERLRTRLEQERGYNRGYSSYDRGYPYDRGYAPGYDRGYGSQTPQIQQLQQSISGLRSELETVRQPVRSIPMETYQSILNEIRSKGEGVSKPEGTYTLVNNVIMLSDSSGINFRVSPNVESNTGILGNSLRSRQSVGSQGSQNSYTSTLKDIERVGPGQFADAEKKSYIMMIRIFDPTQCPKLTESCVQSGAMLGELYMDDYGRTYDQKTFNSLRGEVEPQLSVPFSKVIEEYLGKTQMQAKVSEKPIQGEGTSTSRETLDFQLQPTTTKFLQNLNLKGTTIEAPVALRAYLLATEVFSKLSEDGRTSQQYLKYSFCRDPWQGKLLDDITSYALLAALYKQYDPREGKFLGEDTQAVDAFKTKLVNEQIITSDSTPGTNWKAKFKDLSQDGLAEFFCSASKSTEDIIISPEQKSKIQLLQSAHAKLRGMYDRHLRNVVEFIKTVLVVDDTFLRAMSRPGRYLEEALAEPVLRIHPNFTSNPNGSFEVLQERTNAARKLLSDHYFEVEKVYKDTIQQLTNLATGVASPSPTKGGRRTRKAHRKPYKSTRGKRTRRS